MFVFAGWAPFKLIVKMKYLNEIYIYNVETYECWYNYVSFNVLNWLIFVAHVFTLQINLYDFWVSYVCLTRLKPFQSSKCKINTKTDIAIYIIKRMVGPRPNDVSPEDWNWIVTNKLSDSRFQVKLLYYHEPNYFFYSYILNIIQIYYFYVGGA